MADIEEVVCGDVSKSMKKKEWTNERVSFGCPWGFLPPIHVAGTGLAKKVVTVLS